MTGTFALPLRPAAVALAGLAAVAGAAGVTQHAGFSEPSNLKYALTVAAPLLAAVVIAARDPLPLLVAAVVVALPFAAFTATFAGVSIPLLAPLLLVAVVAAVISGPAPVDSLSPLARSSLVALVLVLIPVLGGSAAGSTLLLIVTVGTVAWLVARVSSTRAGLLTIAGAFVASATLQSGLAIWEAHTGHRLDLYGNAATDTFGPRYFYGFEGKDRPTGSFYDPISYANVVALALPLALVLAFRLRSSARLALLAAAVTCGIGLSLSLSRMSWIGAAVGLVVAVALLPRGPRARAAFALVGVAAVVSAIALAAAPKALSLRFSSIQNPTTAQKTGAEDQQRLRLWGAAAGAAGRQPVFGTGVGGLASALEAEVPGANHAHSTYLEVIGETGLAGGLGLALLIGAGAGSALLGLRLDRVLAAGVCGSLAALLIVWTTDFTVRYVPVAASAAVVFGLAAGLARLGSEAD